MSMTRMTYTPEMDQYLHEIIPGTLNCDVREMFHHKFGVLLTDNQINWYKRKHHLKSGVVSGKFNKGNTPHNKGRKWSEWMSDEGAEHVKRTLFKPGIEPSNAAKLPVGSERIAKGGYVEVKVSRFSTRPAGNDCWIAKQRLVWEQAHGPIPENHVVIFIDGDKRNFDLDNLACVSRADLVKLNQRHYEFYDQESLQASLDIIHLDRKINDVLCPERPCKRCGRIFKPSTATQRTCDRCLGKAKGARA